MLLHVCADCNLQHDTMGINCEICDDGFFRPSGVSHSRPDACHPCTCDVIGSTGLCFKDDADEHLGIVSEILRDVYMLCSRMIIFIEQFVITVTMSLKDHRTHIFEIQVTRFLKLSLQKIDFSKLLSLKILRGFVLRDKFVREK